MDQDTLQASQSNDRKFGTFGGVFTPTVLTILGAIMYLREGWVVGNAGLLGAVAIILIANLITISTGLSIATVATNIRVRAGGAFSIISQSLGLEVGGSVSVPLYLALSISVGFYIFAFTEGWQRIFPSHPEWLIVFAAFAVAFVIAYISANLAVRVQYLILAVIFASLVSIFLGSFAIMGNEGLVHTPQLQGDYPSGSFWEIFAVFFPAVTGVLAGVNMSGDLKDPRASIPKGMLSAVVLTLTIYLALAFWLSRVATPAELVSNETIMVDRAAYAPAVLAGLLAATFSSALSSLIGASRILQAIAKHRVLPGSEPLARPGANGEPRNAMYVTGGIAISALVFGLAAGGVNAIAPLITMFFLIMYATLNGVVVLEQLLGLISFRPLLSIPWFVPLIGLVGCLFAMFLINPIFSLIALVLTVLLYAYLGRRQLIAPWGDVRSGLFATLAEWSAKRVIGLPPSERAWRPSLLVPVQATSEILGSYRFLKALTYPQGSVHIVGIYSPEDKSALEELDHFGQAFGQEGIFSRVTLLESEQLAVGLKASLDVLRGVFFRPNTLFMSVDEVPEEALLEEMRARAKQNDMGVILLAQHPNAGLGREQVVNVWVRERSPSWDMGLDMGNLDMAILMAYQLAKNWDGQINLLTLVADKKDRADAQSFLDGVINLGRMPGNTRAIADVGSLDDFMPQAPQADLNIFGLPPRVDLAFIQKQVKNTRASCIFVQDSGLESALA